MWQHLLQERGAGAELTLSSLPSGAMSRARPIVQCPPGPLQHGCPATTAATAASTQGLVPSQTGSEMCHSFFTRFPSLPHIGSNKGLAGAQQLCVPPVLPWTGLCLSAVFVSPLLPVMVQALSHKLQTKAAGDKPEELSHLLVTGSWNAGFSPVGYCKNPGRLLLTLPSTGSSEQGMLPFPASHSLA